jgi:hypothetical protein
MASAALIHGSSEHHLDHLGPLASFLQIPLIVTEREIERLAEKYYPKVKVRLIEHGSLPFTVVQEFETLFTTLPQQMIREIFFFAEQLLNKQLRTIWVPHGNSDKGHASFFMEALKEESYSLVYGKKMIDFLKKKEALAQLKKWVEIGNFRKQFADKYRTFYQPLVEKEIFAKLVKGNRTILFAPTWQDTENSSSFSQVEQLVDLLPDDFNLIIKPHPNLKWQKPELLTEIKNRKNLLLLEKFPPIYPLLERVDIYLGDLSSIGYDFLSFNRPMFFYNPNQRDAQKDEGLYLFRCGVELSQTDNPYQIIREMSSRDSTFTSVREAVYEYTFGRSNFEEVCKTGLHFHGI